MLCLKGTPTNDDVKDQIKAEYNHIPEQDGMWRRVKNNIKDTGWLTEVNENKQHSHSYGSNSKEFTKDCDPCKNLEVVQVIWKNYHDPRCCNTHQKSEICNVESP